MNVAHQHQHAVGGQRRLGLGAVNRELPRHLVVVAADGHEGDHQRRNQHDDEPRAVRELRHCDDHHDESGGDGPDALDRDARHPARLTAAAQPVPDHAGLLEREGEEDTDGVERDQGVRVPVEHDEQAHAEHRQDEDAVRVREAVPAVRELARHEAVPRQERGHPREIRETRVRREHENQGGDALHQVVERRLPEDQPRQLGVRGLPRGRHHVEDVDQERDAHEQDDQDQAEDGQHLTGVLRLRRPESRDAVGDGLDPGERGAPGREGPQREEQGERLHAPRGAPGRRRRPHVASEPLDKAPADHDQVRADKEVGRAREEPPRLPDAPEVRDRDRDDAGDAEHDPVGVERRDGGRDRVDPGRGADRDGEHIVDQEGGARHQARIAPEVLAGHHVRSAALRVREDRLAERRDHDRDEDRDRDRDRQRGAERRGAGSHQDEQDGLGGVRHGREGVRGEHREPGDAAQPFVLIEAGRDRAADENPLQALYGHGSGEEGGAPAAHAHHRSPVTWAGSEPLAPGRRGEIVEPRVLRVEHELEARRWARSGACRSRGRSSRPPSPECSPCGPGT